MFFLFNLRLCKQMLIYEIVIINSGVPCDRPLWFVITGFHFNWVNLSTEITNFTLKSVRYNSRVKDAPNNWLILTRHLP